MKAELAYFDQHTRAAIDDARALFAALSPDRAVARPRPGAWSPAECLDHLTLTAEAFLLLFAVADGAPRSERSYAPGWLGRWFLAQMDVPVKRGFPTKPNFVPRSTRCGAESLAAFVRVYELLLGRAPQLAALDLCRIRVQSPFAKWMSYPLGLVCYLIPAHCRRHLAQARAAAGELGAA